MCPQARGMPVVNLPRCGFIAASPNPNLTWVIGRPLCWAHLPLRVPPFCFYRFHSGGVLASLQMCIVEELSQARAWSYSPPGSNETQIRMPLFQTSRGGSVWRNWFPRVHLQTRIWTTRWFDSVFRTLRRRCRRAAARQSSCSEICEAWAKKSSRPGEHFGPLNGLKQLVKQPAPKDNHVCVAFYPFVRPFVQNEKRRTAKAPTSSGCFREGLLWAWHGENLRYCFGGLSL